MSDTKIKQVTQRQAELVLRLVRTAAKKKYGYTEEELDGTDLRLVMDFDWIGTGANPAIVSEDLEFEWVYELTEDDAFRVALDKAGLWVEPCTSWSLSVYRAA